MKRLSLLFLVTGMALTFCGHASGADSCTDCHGNDVKMKELGYPQFTVPLTEIRVQLRMPASCTDCHLGNFQAPSKEEAHKGMLTLRAVNRKWSALTRAEMPPPDVADWPSLGPRGKNRATQLGPKRLIDGELKDNPDYRTVIWHDKNPSTLAFNPLIAEKTCGRCHPDHVKGFAKTSMGGAQGVHTQSQYGYWTGPAGPQSCGPWVGTLSQPEQDKFIDEALKLFNTHSTMAMPEGVAYNMQRNCNACHVGCLDCHANPQKNDTTDPRKGVHTIMKKPEPLACYGGGRAFACHAGPLERRRGDGYLRAEFTQASEAGKKILKDLPDVHAGKGIACVDCHESNRETNYHGDLRRDVNCSKCHQAGVEAHAKGLHKNVDCSACHTALIGGYAFNFWTVGGEPGKENPATRIQDYLVDAISPVLIKNPRGLWIPVHPVPHTSGNVKADEVKISRRLLFRNKPDAAVERRYVSNDSYAVTGLVKNLDESDHDTMVWLNIDRVAHGMGKSRTCESCHAATAQKITTNFSPGSYKDVEDGSYTIIADEKGLRITDFKGPGGGPMAKGLAPLKGKWGLKGNFALPKIKDKKLYGKLKKEYEAGKFMH
jgi:hypothetical protein